MREALKFLGGSVLVYLIVAACSASGGGTPAPPASNDRGTGGTRARGGAGGSGTSPGGESSGGMMSTAGEGDPGKGGGPRDSGLLDGMVDPVPDAIADSGSTSGTRLKTRTLTGEDGSRQTVISWYDSQRNENCSFILASDGTTRCLPAAAASASGSYFVDSACTEELVMVVTTTCPTIPRYANRYVAQSDCFYGSSIYLMGTEYTGTAVYIRSGTMCTASTTSPTVFRYFRLGAEVALASFVRATEEVEQ